MKTFGTLREYIEKNNIKIKDLEIITSDTLYLGSLMSSFERIEHLMDNQMYLEPSVYATGLVRCYVQD